MERTLGFHKKNKSHIMYCTQHQPNVKQSWPIHGEEGQNQIVQCPQHIYLMISFHKFNQTQRPN